MKRKKKRKPLPTLHSPKHTQVTKTNPKEAKKPKPQKIKN